MFGFLNFKSSSKTKRVGFEFLKKRMKNTNSDSFIMIHTLKMSEQLCLIQGTLPAEKEETRINEYMTDYNHQIDIVVYGKNSTDETAEKKCEQLIHLGFTNVHWYVGGLFEWLLLQEVYGKTEFPTDGLCRDLLYYRAL